MRGDADMNIFDRLMQDHRMAEQRFAEIERTAETERERRAELIKKLSAEFEFHEIAEEEILYGNIEQLSSIKRAVGDAFEAHAEFDAILREIADMSVISDDWVQRVLELKQMILEHIRMEEEKIFPAARAELGEIRAKELGRQLNERARTDAEQTG
jgi:hemerythrin superfamily protein